MTSHRTSSWLRPGALLAALAALGAACGNGHAGPGPAARPAASADRTEIGTLLDHWHLAAAEANEEAYFDALTPDAVFLGTDATERWSKDAFRAYAHPHFAKGKAWRFRSVRRDVAWSAGRDVAWFDEDLETEKLGPARGSGVVVRTEAGWRIAQYNLTIPIPNDAFDEVKGVIARHLERPSPR